MGGFWYRGVGVRGFGEEGVCFLWVDWCGEYVEYIGYGVGWGCIWEGVGERGIWKWSCRCKLGRRLWIEFYCLVGFLEVY